MYIGVSRRPKADRLGIGGAPGDGPLRLCGRGGLRDPGALPAGPRELCGAQPPGLAQVPRADLLPGPQVPLVRPQLRHGC
eukprot:scaffold6909_cov30-Prasinocladus_malaysianus.AAC.1